MNWKIELVEDDGYVRVTTGGEFSPPEFAAMVEEILGQPYWEPGTPALFDHRKLDFGKSDYRTMMQASQTHRVNDDRIGNGRTALVMSKGVGFGVGRQYQSLIDGSVSAQVQLFTDENKALKWLRTPKP